MTMEMTKAAPTGELAKAEEIRPRFEPEADIFESAEAYHVWLDMPGVDPKDIDVRYEPGTLTVWGKVAPRYDEKASWLVSEYEVGDYHRTFNVTETIDAGKISADYQDGVLRLTLPKVEAARPKRIEVQVK